MNAPKTEVNEQPVIPEKVLGQEVKNLNHLTDKQYEDYIEMKFDSFLHSLND